MFKPLMMFAALLLAGAAQAQQVGIIGDLPRRDGKALVALPGLDTEYGVVRMSEGTRLRTILTRPAGTRNRLPAIFLTQWVSCGSLDFAATASNLLRDIAEQSKMVLIRVERSGTGDSEGQPCSALDYDTEVRHYREAFDQLARHRWIDPERIILFGNSLGATTAPLIAQDKRVAGVVVQGGGALTHLERMIHFDRIFLERSGKYPPAAIHEEMGRRIRFHTEYLLGRKAPEEVERANPDLAGIWATVRGGAEAPPHYGRPYAWHWQAAGHDFLEAWTKVHAPVLVIYGEYDQFETRHGHALIAETVNRLRPGTATFVEIPKADHEIEIYPTAEDAYAYRNGGLRSPLFLETMITWARKVTAAR
jgi:pimeloyl-ACP methyl ester carboxylesterase